MNILDPLFYHCKFNAAAPALCTPSSRYKLVSYGRLEHFIHNVSRKGAGLGLSAGKVVVLFVSDRVLHVALMLGLTRLGVITVSGRNPNLPKELHVDLIMTDGSFAYQGAQLIRVDASWIEGDGIPLSGDKIAATASQALCRIILTSGTTGLPKAVGLSHQMVVQRIARHFFIGGELLPTYSRTYCDLGFATSLAFQFLIYVLWRGGTAFLPSDNIPENVDVFERYRVQNMITAPSGVANYLRFYEDNRSLPCNLDMILTGGSILAKSLSERVRARMCNNLIAAYGSTEAGMVAGANADLIADVAGAVGYVFPDMRVEIVDASGQTIPIGTEGFVRIRSPYIVDGYLGESDEIETAFRDGWFYPGDIGHLTSDGLLVIAGRQQAVVNLGGDKLQPELVEGVIQSFAGIEEAAVFGRANELGVEEPWALVVGPAPVDENALRRFCASRLPVSFIPVRFVTAARLPRNAMGKIERGRLSELIKGEAN